MQATSTQIRWLIRRDMPEVLDIERAAFPLAWTEEDFLSCLRQRNCIGMVAERDGAVVGYMIYELHTKRLRLLNFAVDPKHKRTGVGMAMVLRLIDKLSGQRREFITTEVRETNLAAQLFFRAMGFRCVGVLNGRYDDTSEDAYLMRFSVPQSKSFTPKNRISKFI